MTTKKNGSQKGSTKRTSVKVEHKKGAPKLKLLPNKKPKKGSSK